MWALGFYCRGLRVFLCFCFFLLFWCSFCILPACLGAPYAFYDIPLFTYKKNISMNVLYSYHHFYPCIYVFMNLCFDVAITTIQNSFYFNSLTIRMALLLLSETSKTTFIVYFLPLFLSLLLLQRLTFHLLDFSKGARGGYGSI